MIEFFFPTPIYYHIFDDTEIVLIHKEIHKYDSSIDKKRLINPWGDTVLTNFMYGHYDHSFRYLPILEGKIINCLKEYLNFLKINFSKIDIVESWINYSYQGGYQNFHMHDGYDISGIYYYQTNGVDGDLFFIHPSTMNRFHKITSQIDPKITYKPEVGKLLLFPSFLEHSVGINSSNSVRISLAFNAKIS